MATAEINLFNYMDYIPASAPSMEPVFTAPRQYQEMKKKHPDAVLLFRVGDFYECFADDAKDVSNYLGLTLTRRANGNNEFTYLAGFPHHALDVYLPKIVRKGRRVAICEQLEDPKVTKKLVKRGVSL